MQLIQFNVYYNHHLYNVHCLNRSYSRICTSISANSWPPIRTYISASNISHENMKIGKHYKYGYS